MNVLKALFILRFIFKFSDIQGQSFDFIQDNENARNYILKHKIKHVTQIDSIANSANFDTFEKLDYFFDNNGLNFLTKFSSTSDGGHSELNTLYFYNTKFEKFKEVSIYTSKRVCEAMQGFTDRRIENRVEYVEKEFNYDPKGHLVKILNTRSIQGEEASKDSTLIIWDENIERHGDWVTSYNESGKCIWSFNFNLKDTFFYHYEFNNKLIEISSKLDGARCKYHYLPNGNLSEIEYTHREDKYFYDEKGLLFKIVSTFKE